MFNLAQASSILYKLIQIDATLYNLVQLYATYCEFARFLTILPISIKFEYPAYIFYLFAKHVY